MACVRLPTAAPTAPLTSLSPDVTGGFERVYQHEAAWAEVMFNEWGADGVKVDHMCQGANCGSGVQGHMMAVEFQRPTMERWSAAIAAIGKTNTTLFQNCGETSCSPQAPAAGL